MDATPALSMAELLAEQKPLLDDIIGIELYENSSRG